MSAGDEARRRIERNLHDGTQQRLIALGLDLQRARAALPEGQRDTHSALMRLEQEQIATALLAILDPGTGALTVASAGHLPPLVRTDEGKVDFLDVEPGPPLGTGAGGYTDLEVMLTDGATVLLYTDGLVEDRRLPIDEGLATLAAAATVSREPELLCDRALVALGRDSEHDDDTAMLAVHFGGL